MAQDLTVRPIRATTRWPGRLTLRDGWKRLDVLPKALPLPPVNYTPALIVYVGGAASLALALAIWLVRPIEDWLTLSVGSAIVFLMALYAVRSLTVMQTAWTPSVFLNLGLSITFGPAGAAGAAIAETFGASIRARNGLFRSTFNLANHFMSDIVAWAVFAAISLHGGLGFIVLASLAASMAQYCVNYGMVAVVLKIANPSALLMKILWGDLGQSPYSIGYGLAAWTFRVMYRTAGTLGFCSLMVPVILLQGFLVLFARRVDRYEAQQAAHQKERETLLQRAVDASEAERRRIARDLHDGVVQNLAGMAFTLTATASGLRDQIASNGNHELLEVLDQSAEETRAAMKDLRTLIIEIAPPTLRREGLHAALLEVLQTIKSDGTKTRLELPSNMRLRQDRASLIFRVAQEVLRNVAAHAEAKHVSVVLKEVDNMAVLRIVDDGRGFTPEDVARRRTEGHVGTNAIVELAEEAGGTLKIDSTPGKGTRVVLTVPTE